MSGDRTEAPTPRRVEAARRRGEVARSAELTGAVALATGLAALAATGPALVRALADQLRAGLAAAVTSRPLPAPWPALRAAAAEVARLSAGPMLAALAAASLAGALQAGFLLAPAAAAPRLDRLDPGAGLRRLLSGERLVAVGLGLAKGLLVAALAGTWLRAAWPTLAALPRSAAGGAAAPGQLAALLAPLAWSLLAALLAFGAADLLLARRRHGRRLRMTRDEVRREQKEDEGDPAHKAERRRRHQALLEAAPVARSTCVVVNPTHVAVALHHRRERGEAPRVVAKGMGPAARRIRSEARRAGVPVVRDPPLARALFRLAEIGDEIPEPLWEAAAAVLVHLHGGAEAEAGTVPAANASAIPSPTTTPAGGPARAPARAPAPTPFSTATANSTPTPTPTPTSTSTPTPTATPTPISTPPPPKAPR